jgi:hypothetical protein
MYLMSKKLILAGMALVALAAFALPATASAKPRLCETEGGTCTTLGAGVKITSHLVTVAKITAGGATLVECTEAALTGTLTRNDATAVEGNIEIASFSGTIAGGECTSPLGAGGIGVTTTEGNGVPWCVRAAGTEDKVTIRGAKCSEELRPITIVLDTTNFGTCRYTRSTAVEGTLTTHTSSSEDGIITITSGANSEFGREATSGVLCPERITLDVSLTLTTDNEAKTTLYAENV